MARSISIATERGPQRGRRFASALAGLSLVAGLGLTAAPAEAAQTMVMHSSFSKRLTCHHHYDSAAKALVNAGYTSQVHNSTCGKKWTWSKGFVYEYRITASRP